jgi:Zn-finger nucleic acid-binding protein
MPVYSECICKRCNRPYFYWKEKGLFNSRKFCPDCETTRKSKAIYGLPLEDIADKKPRIDKVWADNQAVDLLVRLSGLTEKEKEAVSQFRRDNQVPYKLRRSYDLAIKKMKRSQASGQLCK